MKKLDSITTITFTDKAVLFEDIPMQLGVNIDDWINEFCNMDYKIDSYIERFPELKQLEFNTIQGISIKLRAKIVDRIIIFPSNPNNEGTLNEDNNYKGDVFIFEKKIKRPFMSDEIEDYFPNIKIKNSAIGHSNRFRSWQSIWYPIDESTKIEIMMKRESEYVSSITYTNI